MAARDIFVFSEVGLRKQEHGEERDRGRIGSNRGRSEACHVMTQWIGSMRTSE
jgi:hypothetical protein